MASTVLNSCCILRAPLRSRNHHHTPTPQEMIVNRPGVDSQSLLSQAFPHGSESKESACNARDPGLTPGLERSPEEGNGYPLQCSCLENPRDGGAWWAAIYGVAQSQTRLKRLSSSSSSRGALWATVHEVAKSRTRLSD